MKCPWRSTVNQNACRAPNLSIWVGGLEESHDGAQYGMKGGANHEKETKGEHGKVEDAFLSLVEHKQEE